MDKLTKRPNETDLAYHKRLIYGKLVDGTLADEDYSELAPYVYGREYSTDVARRMMYGSKRTLELLSESAEQSITSDDILSELDAKRIELQKDKQKLFDQRSALNKLIRERARQEELNEILMGAVERGNLPSLDYQEPDEGVTLSSDNDILVSLNDIHYGATVNNYWNKYDSDICRDMMRRYLDRVIAIGRLHRSENCIVWENGDAISGNIHHSIAVSNKENVIQQVIGVSELIAEFLAELSKHFISVQFVSVCRSRVRSRAQDRARRLLSNKARIGSTARDVSVHSRSRRTTSQVRRAHCGGTTTGIYLCAGIASMKYIITTRRRWATRRPPSGVYASSLTSTGAIGSIRCWSRLAPRTLAF